MENLSLTRIRFRPCNSDSTPRPSREDGRGRQQCRPGESSGAWPGVLFQSVSNRRAVSSWFPTCVASAGAADHAETRVAEPAPRVLFAAAISSLFTDTKGSVPAGCP